MEYLIELVNNYLSVFVFIVLIISEIARSRKMESIDAVLSDIDKFLDNMVVLQVASPEDLPEDLEE